MSDEPYAVIVDGSGAVTEKKLGDHSGGRTIATSVTVVSNEVIAYIDHRIAFPVCYNYELS